MSEPEQKLVFQWIANQSLGFGQKDQNGASLIHYAANDGNVNALEHLLQALPESSQIDNTRYTYVHWAVIPSEGKWLGEAVLEWTLKKGYNLSPHDSEQNTPMHTAARHGNIPAMEWLHSHGVRVDVKNGGNFQPIHRATQGGHIDALKWLLEHGADINAKGGVERSTTPLDVAISVPIAEWIKTKGGKEGKSGGGGCGTFITIVIVVSALLSLLRKC